MSSKTSPARDLLYRPVPARLALGGFALGLGAVFRWVLDLSLDPAFFVTVVAWLAVAVVTLRRLLPSPEARTFFVSRLFLFCFEVVVAVWIGRFVAASSWPAVLLVLLPVVEWNLLFPGSMGMAGSVGAVLAAGAVFLGEALGFVPPSSLLPVVDDRFTDPGHALASFLLALLVIVGLSRVVGRYAESSRRRGGKLQALNHRLRALSDDLRRSHDELEDAYVELRRTQADLINSARMATLGNLVRGLAHEINTPLGALASNHDVARRALGRLQVILEDEVVEPDELEEVRRIVKAVCGIQSTSSMAVERMKKLVRDLRTFGRPDRAEIDRIDVHETLESALQLLRHELGDRVTVKTDLGFLPRVECYPHRLSQVFMNLLLNAVQAISGRGEITVRTRPAGETVEIRIADTGVGIPPENLERIFEPGFTTKGSRVGMGMGLLISARIVEEHGGEISVESTVGKGTAFTLVLPVRMAEVAGSGTPAPR